MTEDKEKEFLYRLSVCIGEGDLDVCVIKAVRDGHNTGTAPRTVR